MCTTTCKIIYKAVYYLMRIRTFIDMMDRVLDGVDGLVTCCIEEINQYCSTYQSVPSFWLSWGKVEMKTEKYLPYISV